MRTVDKGTMRHVAFSAHTPKLNLCVVFKDTGEYFSNTSAERLNGQSSMFLHMERKGANMFFTTSQVIIILSDPPS